MNSRRPDRDREEDYRYRAESDLRDTVLGNSSDRDDDPFSDYEERRSDEWDSEQESQTPLPLKIGIALISFVIIVSLLAGLIGPFLGGSRQSQPPAVTFQEATVIEVIDGRTIVAEVDGEQVTIRYIGIEPFEIGNRWRDISAQANQQILKGGRVMLEADELDRDEFGRWLRYVYVGRNLVNGLLVRNGLGVLGPMTDGNDRYRAEMTMWSDQARSEELGIWGDPGSRSAFQ